MSNSQRTHKKLLGLLFLLAATTIFTSCPFFRATTPVGNLTIKGVTPPVVNETPATSVQSTDQWTLESITWSPNDNPFLGETEYTAKISLKAADGYTFEGVDKDSFIVEGATVTNNADSGEVTAVFPATGTQVVTDLNTPMVPLVGEAPVLSLTSEQYTGEISWTSGGVDFSSNFVSSTHYNASITLNAKKGWRFEEGLNFTADGKPWLITIVEDSNNKRATLTVEYDHAYTVVTNLTISNLTASVTRETPINTSALAAANTSAQWTLDSISWAPADNPFKADINYTASINLTAKPEYTFYSLNESSFDVDGKPAGTSIGFNVATGALEVTFPATDPLLVTDKVITGITAPIAGYAPGSAVDNSANNQWTAEISSWKDEANNTVSGNFSSNTVYKAIVNLTAQSDYTFDGMSNSTVFTVSGCTEALISGISGKNGTVTITYPKTDVTVTQTTLNELTLPTRGQTPDTSVTYDQWTASNFVYKDADQNTITAPTTFVVDEIYTLTFNVSAKPGYTFVGTSSFNMEGVLPSNIVFTIDPTDFKKGTIAITFPPALGELVTTKTITGLVVPESGSYPDTEIDSSAQWTPVVSSWKDSLGNTVSGKFVGNKTYTVIIQLTAADGYTFQGMPDGTAFIVSGSTSAVIGNINGKTATLTITFPETPFGTGDVDNIEIPDIDGNPVEMKMVYVYANNTSFPSTVNAWDEEDNTTRTVNKSFLVADSEMTCELVKAAFDWALENGKIVRSEGPHNGIGTHYVKWGYQNILYNTTGVITLHNNEEDPHNVFQYYDNDSKYKDLSMNRLSWYGAIKVSNWLSEMCNLEPVYSITLDAENNWNCYSVTPDLNKNGFRLPTENEWMLAARLIGKNPPPEGTGSIVNDCIEMSGYYWSPWNYASGATENYTNEAATRNVAWYGNVESLTRVCTAGGNYRESRTGNTNWLGLYDMSGLNREYCYDYAESSPGSFRVITKGGPDVGAFTDPAGLLPQKIYPKGVTDDTDARSLRLFRTAP